MARRKRKTEDKIQEVGQTNEKEKNENLDDFVNEINKEFDEELVSEENVTPEEETNSPLIDAEIKEEISVVEEPVKKVNIESLSRAQLRIFERTGILPK